MPRGTLRTVPSRCFPPHLTKYHNMRSRAPDMDCSECFAKAAPYQYIARE
jgi:hypothetical protein